MPPEIIGAHVLLYSDNPEADRAFFRDVLNFPAVDAGGGWLIFALPPAEVGIHPSGDEGRQLHGGRQLLSSVLYLMCDDLPGLMKSLQARGVSCSPVEEEDWGIKTTIQLPSHGEIGLYQPTHPTAIDTGNRSG
jgi:catechol 2,3-dioxygenase-like lactoylglutathione lyase family enzyme